MKIEPLYWQIVVSVLGVGVQLYITERSRRQTAMQSKEALDMQRFMSHRSTAAFVADKRQKWIDELRTDMAFHLALSQEIVWKWDSVRSRAVIKIEQDSKDCRATKSEIPQEIADSFSIENGARDREHQERHIRIKLRLNPSENLHIQLRTCLDEIREILNNTQSASSKKDASDLIMEMFNKISHATELTEKVLKYEWNRVKQEVAYPEALMSSIPEPEKSVK